MVAVIVVFAVNCVGWFENEKREVNINLSWFIGVKKFSNGMQQKINITELYSNNLTRKRNSQEEH